MGCLTRPYTYIFKTVCGPNPSGQIRAAALQTLSLFLQLWRQISQKVCKMNQNFLFGKLNQALKIVHSKFETSVTFAFLDIIDQSWQKLFFLKKVTFSKNNIKLASTF